MKKVRQKFKAGDYVYFKHSMFNPSVYWVVANPEPDTEGRIVVINRSGEYNVVYQADMKGT